MNVIVVISDTLRRDHLGCYGNPWIQTPNLDAFAQESLTLDRAYISSFPTVPCRNDVLTGRYTFTYRPWAPLEAGQTTLPELLGQAGRITGLVADTPHPFTPGYNFQRGFQSWEIIRGQEHDPWKAHPREVSLPCAPEKLRSPDSTVAQYLRNVHERRSEADYFPARTFTAAAEWLEHNHRHPFFLYVDTFDPHEPWDPPRHYVERYDPGYEGEEVIYPRYDVSSYLTDAELKHCRALYAAEVSLVDTWFGHFMNRVRSLGLLANTAILFLADHGFYLGEHGFIGKSLITPEYQQALPLYPEVAWIPFLAYLPEGLHGERREGFAQPVDILPTVLELCGLPMPDGVQGRSLAPLLRGEVEAVRPVAISSPCLSAPTFQVPHPTNRASITDAEWTLIYGSQVDRVQEPEVTAMVDSLLRQVRTLEQGPIRPQLFHLPEDPFCNRDVLEAHPEQAQRLHAAFVQFLEEAGVPETHLRFFRAL
ncbi:MAG TPA: sulfatase [Chthonomonadaceae bacterium]|nr:sulfatase [Chthonomonadaceae bacterium]